MPGDVNAPPPPVAAVAASLRRAIAGGAIAPGERIRAGVPGWPCGLSGTTVRSALAIVRGQGLAYWHRYGYYAAPAGPPLPTVSIRLGRVLAGVRAAAGVTVAGLAADIVDGDGPWGPGGREHMIGRRVAEITAAENGAWQPRWVWERIDAAVSAGGTLLRVHDNLFTGQDFHRPITTHRKGKPS